MPDYPRYGMAGRTYFFTVNLLERYRNDLLVRHIEILRTVVRKVRGQRPFHIDAWGDLTRPPALRLDFAVWRR